MMKAIKNFMNKPIAYGAYFKYCTVCASISLALCGWAYYQMSKLNNWVDTKDEESNLEEIAQMVERHFIVEMWIRSPLSFFIFIFGG